MAIKKINTDLQIEAGLLDGDGNSGTANQILISTGTGVDWVDGSGSSIIGGPYLPLAGGTMTGDLLMDGKAGVGNVIGLATGTSSNAMSLKLYTYNNIDPGGGLGTSTGNMIQADLGSNLVLRQTANDGNITFQSDDGAGGIATYLTLDGSSTDAYFSNPGNVGIGTASPGDPLTVVGKISSLGGTNNAKNVKIYANDSFGYLTTNASKIYMSTQLQVDSGLIGSYNEDLQLQVSGSTKMYINSAGNVGIGTTSPTAPLTIANANGGNWNDGLIIDDASGWAATVYKRNNVPKMFNGLYSGNDNYIWMSAGYSNSGTTITAPRADAVLMARPETDDLQIYLDTHFGGNVGIGTTDPDKQLTFGQVNDDAIQIRRLTTSEGNNSAGSGISWTWNNSSSDTETWAAIRAIMPGSSNSHITFSTRASAASFGEKMRISDVGNVGIGTTSPLDKLHVNGRVRTSTSGVAVGDTNALIYRNSNDLQLITYGGFDINLMPSGNVGIGTTSPAQKLHVSGRTRVDQNGQAFDLVGTDHVYSAWYPRGTSNGRKAYMGYSGASTTDFTVMNEDNGAFVIGTNNAERMRIISNGNVGIGTTSPGDKLEVSGNVYAHAFNSTGTLSRYNGSGGIAISGLAGNAYAFISAYSNSGGAGKNLSLQKDGGNVGIGTTSPVEKLHVEGNVLINGAAPYVSIKTTQTGTPDWKIYNSYNSVGDFAIVGGSSGGNKFNIQPNGNVGIGTTSPVAKLDVVGTSGGPTVFDYQYVTNAGLRIHGDESAMDIVGTDNGNHASTILLRNGNEGFGLLNNPTLNTLQFRSFTATADNFNIHDTGSNLSSLVDIITLEKSGNVGIGTTSPSEKLEVLGSIKVSNAYPRIYLADTQGVPRTFSIGTSNEDLIINSGSTDVLSILGASGNVGIGITSPSQDLHIASTNDGTTNGLNTNQLKLSYTASTVGAASSLAFGVSANNNFTGAKIAHERTGGNSVGDLTFWTRETSGSATDYDLTAEKMRITSSGNVGIGTTSPSRKLSIENGGFDMFAAGGTSVDAFSVVTHNYVFSDENEDAVYSYANSEHEFSTQGFPRVNIDSVGLVGIGTTSPSSLLHVSGGELDVSGGDGYKIEDNPWAYWASDLLTLGDWDGVGYATRIMGSNSSEVMRVTGTNVGIGTTDPGTKLDVVASTTGKTWADYAGTVGTFERNGDSNINIISSNTGVGGVWFGDTDSMVRGRIRYEHASDRMELWTNNSEKVSITSGGNVGIGTTSPSYKLDVDGEVRVGDNQKLKLWDNAFSAIITPLDAHLALTTTRAQDNIYFDPGNSTKVVMEAGGNVGIGVTSPTSRFHVKQTLASPSVPMAYFEADRGPSAYGATNVRVDNLDYGYGMKFYRSGTYDSSAVGFINGSSTVGSISIGTSSTSYNTTSDYRLKENVTSITDGITRIKQLEPKRFNFIGQTDIVDGFLAHEAKQVVPEAVTGEKDEVLPNGDPLYQGIDQAKLVPLLTAALQEAVAKIENLENRIQILENN